MANKFIRIVGWFHFVSFRGPSYTSVPASERTRERARRAILPEGAFRSMEQRRGRVGRTQLLIGGRGRKRGCTSPSHIPTYCPLGVVVIPSLGQMHAICACA